MHQWNGYYRIESTYSDLVLTAPTGFANSVVTQTSYASQDTQVWKFIEQSDGTYKISPKSNTNLYMAAGDISSTADQDLEIKTVRSDDGDKWMLRRATLKCWYSDSNTAYAWVKKPSSVYYEVLDDADGTNIENRISYAMNEWNQALDIPFYRTSDSSANIRCVSASYNYFYTNLGIDIDLYSGAYTEYTTVPGEIVTTSWDGQEKNIMLLEYATIYVLHEIRQKPEWEQNTTMTHEFGHALGYAGHSLNSEDIMLSGSLAQQLTSRDIAHISQFCCYYKQ